MCSRFHFLLKLRQIELWQTSSVKNGPEISPDQWCNSQILKRDILYVIKPETKVLCNIILSGDTVFALSLARSLLLHTLDVCSAVVLLLGLLEVILGNILYNAVGNL